MSEPVAEVTPEPSEAPEATPTQNVDELPQWARDALKKANTEAAKARVESKELKEGRAAKAELDQIRESQKTESQKITERAEAAERRAVAAETDAVRFRIAAKHGIGEEDFDLLGAGTAEEIEDRAKRIAAKNAAAGAQPESKSALPTDKPVAKLRPGATGSETSLTAPNLYPSSWIVPGRVTS